MHNDLYNHLRKYTHIQLIDFLMNTADECVFHLNVCLTGINNHMMEKQ